MRDNYCLEMSFTGTTFFGWQSQPHGNTIQDYTEAALKEALGVHVRLVPASRTDTGVHAAQHFAMFRVQRGTILPPNLIDALNQDLPSSIRVRALNAVSDDFHPRKFAKKKVYCYRVCYDPRPTSDTVINQWRVYRPIDVEVLNAELQSLVGCHDFTSFCASGSDVKSKVRDIERIKVTKRDGVTEVWFTGEGFLKQMIRIIMGSAIERACGNPKAEPLAVILAAKDRLRAMKTAPGQGLTLEKIIY